MDPTKHALKSNSEGFSTTVYRNSKRRILPLLFLTLWQARNETGKLRTLYATAVHKRSDSRFGAHGLYDDEPFGGK